MKKPSISFHKNFLDSELLKKIKEYTNRELETYKWRTSHCWKREIKRFSSPIAILEVPEVFSAPIQQRFHKINTKWKPLDKKNIMFYVWSPGSYIGWHNDKGHEFGATVYLNENWNINHGGVFLYQSGKVNDPEGLKVRLPRYNECAINHGEIFHCISITAPDAPLRTTLQIFGSNENT